MSGACPGLPGSLRALKELKGRAEDEELVAVVENNLCAVDAVQVMTGCTFGKGNLIFRDYGKQVYTLSADLREKASAFPSTGRSLLSPARRRQCGNGT